MSIPKLVAHRGYMACYPENTLIGLEAALEAGACFVEFDIQMNADREFIVMHDDNFLRTANVDCPVFSMSTKACQDISVHNPDWFGKKFYPQRVPHLQDILTLLNNYPNTTALLEIKKESPKHWGIAAVMEPLFDILRNYSGQCAVISFDEQAIAYTQRHTGLTTGWVLHRYDAEHYQRALRLKPDYLVCNYKKIPDGKPSWQEFKHWMLYDVTDPELALQYGELGIELIETADIGGMLQHPVLKKTACPYGL